MAENTQPRKLTTIVALDVAGYSARTEADEAGTTAEVAKLRSVIERIAGVRGGRVFNTAGDGFMLEFGSSAAAVEAAFALAEECEPKLRVGVHLGDVVVQPNGDLLGHGVNVAARLMARSEPGSALVSADVHRTIRGPLAERLISQGTLQLDKMTEKIEAFALATSGTAEVASPSKSREPLVAVLPFDNLSDDREMQFFSDGVSEEIIQRLSRGAGMKVIGRTSSFQFRGAERECLSCVTILASCHSARGWGWSSSGWRPESGRIASMKSGTISKPNARRRVTSRYRNSASELAALKRYDRGGRVWPFSVNPAAARRLVQRSRHLPAQRMIKLSPAAVV
jgi:class 3 adenylate cyclase